MSPQVRNTIAAADEADTEPAQPWLNPQIKRIALGAGAYIAFVATAALWQGSINKLAVVLVAGQLILFATIVSWYEKHDEHRAETDDTARRVDAITAHLTGNDLASNGRHATPATEPPRHERPVPYPRSDAA